jgi:hypothetical protein
MNWQKVIIVLLIPVGINLIIGCCECLDSVFFEYTNCSVSLENLDNSEEAIQVSSDNQVPKAAFGLRLKLERKQDMCSKSWEPLFITGAFATTCDCPPEIIFQPLDSVLSVRIKTQSDFDATHPAGSDLSEYFSILSYREFIPLAEYLDDLQNDLYYLLPLEFDLMLMTAPPLSGDYQFEVEIELSDGRKLSNTSPTVTLL